MEESAGLAAAAPTVLDDWIVSEIPGRGMCVRLSRDVVQRLGMAVREGFGALPHRGLETGGLLLGSTRKDGPGRIAVEVTDFEPVDCEHASGPSYLLSDVDRRLLEARISSREANSKRVSIIGFYRSHTRRNFAITVEDAALFSAYFRKQSDVFLLVKSNEDGPPVCGFLVRKAGREIYGAPDASFPLNRTLFEPPERVVPVRVPIAASPAPLAAAETAAVAPAAAAPAPVAAPVPAVVKVPVQAAVRVARPKLPLPMSGRAWLAVAAGVLILLAATLATQGRKPPAPLALSVIATGENLRFTWNHDASREATHGVLRIHDGGTEHQFELDARQLSAGSVSYWPRSNDVDFQLELTSPGGTVKENVRAIGGPTFRSTADSPGAAPVPASAAPPAAPVVSQAAAPLKEPVRPQPRVSPVGSASRTNTRQFTAPADEPAPSTDARAALPEPPPLANAPAPAVDRGKDVLQTIAPPSLGARGDDDPGLKVDPEPVPRLVRSIPLIGRRAPRSDYIAPVPTAKSTLLQVPHRAVTGQVNIDVKVYVNASGKVEFAELLSEVAEANRDLATLATFSARRWEFTPAREGQNAVPGEVILHYKFGPGGKATAR
jgi:hypothetical protein